MTLARLIAIGLLSLGIGAATPAAAGLAPRHAAVSDGPAMQTPAQPAAGLSPGAREVARLIGVQDAVDRYLQLPASDRNFGSDMSRDAMLLRMEVSDAVLAASLDADGVLAELDSELSTLTDTRSQLEDRRDHALGINTIAAIVAGGVGGVVGTAMQLSDKTSRAGNYVGVSGGIVSTVLSFIGLRQQSGGSAEFSDAPNMLAPFFDRAGEFHARYPEALWQYLNDPIPTEPDKGTRRERLTRDWLAQGRIERADNPKGRDKIAFLTSSSSEKRKLTIGLISDRQAMLQSVRIWVELMKRDLSKLMLAVRAR